MKRMVLVLLAVAAASCTVNLSPSQCDYDPAACGYGPGYYDPGYYGYSSLPGGADCYCGGGYYDGGWGYYYQVPEGWYDRDAPWIRGRTTAPAPQLTLPIGARLMQPR